MHKAKQYQNQPNLVTDKVKNTIMKNHFLFLIWFFLIPQLLFGGQNLDCLDLTVEKEKLEDLIKDLEESEDKEKLEIISNFLNKCVSADDLKKIQYNYFSLNFDLPEERSYSTILENILEKRGLSCSIEKLYMGNSTVEERLNKVIENHKAMVDGNKYIKSDKTKRNGNIYEDLYKKIKKCKPAIKELIQSNNSIETVNFTKTVENFKNEFGTLLNEIVNVNNTEISTDYLENTENVPSELGEGDMNTDESTFHGIRKFLDDWLIYLLIGTIGIAVFVVFYSNSRKPKSTDKKEKKYNKYSSHIENISKRIEKLEKDNYQINNEIKNIREDIIRQNNIIEILKSPINHDIKKSQPTPSTPRRPEIVEPELNIIYFASPNLNGEFLIRTGTNEVRQGASIYKFFVNSDGRTAKFEFFNQPTTFKAALDDPDRVKPVCEPKNAYSSNAREIITVKQGTARKEGDKWKVTAKAEIRYE